MLRCVSLWSLSFVFLSAQTRRRSRGESLDLGSKDADAGGAAVDGVGQDVGLMMKAGRVSLGKIKKGAKVKLERPL